MITKEKTISYIFLQLQQVDELIWLLHFICAAAGVMSLQKAPLLIHYCNEELGIQNPGLGVGSTKFICFFAILHLLIFHYGEQLQCAPL